RLECAMSAPRRSSTALLVPGKAWRTDERRLSASVMLVPHAPTRRTPTSCGVMQAEESRTALCSEMMLRKLVQLVSAAGVTARRGGVRVADILEGPLLDLTALLQVGQRCVERAVQRRLPVNEKRSRRPRGGHRDGRDQNRRGDPACNGASKRAQHGSYQPL